MKIKIVVSLIVCFCFNALLISTTFHIKQDGTGDFTTIQEGIDAAQFWASDTILVYPGTYFENIDFNSKIIIVTSLYNFSLQDSIILETVIDGNQNGSVVTLDHAYEGAKLCGFTIQNGSGTDTMVNSTYLLGGGIYSENSDATIEKCVIQNNTAHIGAGIYAGSVWEGDACLTLKGCTIRNNHALLYGGGLSIAIYASVNFDQTILSNIFLNSAGCGSDIFRGSTESEPIQVYLNKFTVMEPDNFFFYDHVGSTFSCLQAELELLNCDLYVSPDGNNENTGLTPDEPLKTISFAMKKIKSDSLALNTIFLSEGVYSKSQTGEEYPINLRDFVTISGSDMYQTILDGDSQTNVFLGHDNEREFVINNLSIINCDDDYTHDFQAPIQLYYPSNAIIESVFFHNNFCEYTCVLEISTCSPQSSYEKKTNFLNNIVEYNFGVDCIRLYGPNSLIIENTEFHENAAQIVVTIGYSSVTSCQLKNVLIWGMLPSSNGIIHMGGNSCMDIINSTLADYTNGSLWMQEADNNLTLINTIFYGPGNQNITSYSTGNSSITVYNSLIKNGENAVNITGNTTLNWLDGNLDTDPLWLGTGEFPYALSSASPCINAGTPDTTGLFLPEFDLAGNPRIYEDIIDMGAYEWNGTNITNNQLPVSSYQLTNFPNPFNPDTNISFSIKEEDYVSLNIYNTRGQLVKTLISENLNDGVHFTSWNGKDNSNRSVASGIYFYKMDSKGYSSVNKMILMK